MKVLSNPPAVSHHHTGAPLHVTDDLITTFNISLVVRGSVRETSRVVSGKANDAREDPVRYAVAKAKNIFRCVDGGTVLLVVPHTA